MSVYLKRQSGSDPGRNPGPPSFPPEYVNFSAADEILSITSVFTALALVLVILRLYVRGWMLRFLGSDDYVMLFAMVLSLIVMVCFVQEIKYGLGKHAVVMLSDSVNYTKFSKWLYIHSLIIMVAVSAVKVSIALFLMRLAERTRKVRFLWGMIVFLVLFTVACACTLIFQCSPIAAAWDYSLRMPPAKAKCFSMNTFRNIGMFNSIVNIVTDLLFASLPVPLIWELQINIRAKLTLASILSLGFFASAAAIVKCVSQWNVLDEPDWTVHDSFNVWNCIELNIGIVAACLPALKPLFNWFLETARAITSSGGRSGIRRPTGYGSRSTTLGYMKQHDSFAMASISRSRGDAAMGKIGPYVAQVSVGVKEVGKKAPGLDRGLPLSSDLSRDSGGSGSKASKEGEKHWDVEARKTSGDGILSHEEGGSRPRGHVILRTTEVHVS
ncbi:phosphatidylserine decarboxylase [Diplodia corticola]|uniref:Phosphatidylserine decarboxylase n=1 Tax=Diplodia corticola TaxID=236234 RepID=A0A1J9RJ56_9PEZI|nr:phosphatidylserine decarboxylase [Diplodia corticola]OJD40489.1 phosphatidylserine decarboxylase [Diplodia corticola]